MFYKEISHKGLNKHKVIQGKDPELVAIKVAQQEEAWAEEYRRKVAADEEREHQRQAIEEERQAKLAAREHAKAAKEAAREALRQDAKERTEAAQAALAAVAAVLSDALSEKHVIAWESLKDHSVFDEPEPVCSSLPPPTRPTPPPPPPEPDLPPEPRFREAKIEQVKLGLMDKLIGGRRTQRIQETADRNRRATAQAQEHHEKALEQWRRFCSNAKTKWQRSLEAHRQSLEHVNRTYEQALEAHRQQVAKRDAEHATRLEQWNGRRQQHLRRQEEANAAVDELQSKYLMREPSAVAEYCQIVLMQSEYPIFFDREYQVEYNTDTGILIADVRLPSIDGLPKLKEARYVQSREEISEIELSEKELQALYDALLYRVALRTIYELCDADAVMGLTAIVFNGWVRSTDRSTGKETHSCIMSVETQTAPFMALNLAEVDPKACFRSLKGLASPQLHTLTPIAPVMSISRDDARFIASREVADQLDAGYNLAAMPWDDFEHLIRELFAGEFSQDGAEVRVTQASRDGGVDAVAFDPDPIRGGKIVIQAKRYTNTVSVSAVRDLYGTVVNEGATKGILVTTSDYGPDAHEFAKGKPLTLLTGNNLLHLLAKHGHKARIDLQEAKRVFAESAGE